MTYKGTDTQQQMSLHTKSTKAFPIKNEARRQNSNTVKVPKEKTANPESCTHPVYDQKRISALTACIQRFTGDVS